MREWIDFERNGVYFREIRSDKPPVDRCEFEWDTIIDGRRVGGKFEVSHELIVHSIADWRDLVSRQVWRTADHFVNGDRREVERRRHYEEWRKRSIYNFD